jgi:nitrogen-specific signal transduction histidine kinase
MSFRRKDGEKRMINWSVSSFCGKSTKTCYVVVVIHDMTERYRTEERLRQSQKIEAVGQLASGIAHDFNNLLSVINGYSDLLKTKMSPDDPHYPHILSILEAGQKGASLVAQLMAFSRQNEEGEREVMDLRNVVPHTLRMLKHWLGPNVWVESRFGEDLWPVQSKPIHIDQILVNLCINARDAMPEGGQLSVRLSNFTCSHERNDFGLPPGPYVVLTVEDTGVGIREEVRERLFEPFFTTKPAGKGTGLGLPTVYGIVKQHGGTIRVESTPGQGSSFHIYLPAYWPAHPPTTSSVTKELSRPSSERKTVKVGIACGDDLFASCLEKLLDLDGNRGVRIPPEEDSADLASVDLLVTDVPHFNRLRALLSPGSLILLLVSPTETVPQTFSHRMVPYPCSLDTVRNEIRKLLRENKEGRDGK